ncbi:hypothetical protein OAG1_11410 [Agarivorans sp. OAG1]|uniref:ChaN family lipoprotein n=1 Tax=Agarivorans sp. OAG1 TaxID=3082387 RepID=UPI002B2B899B|nr:hypothetical protein OAG1_11410 [Agarivorans sp. OAG1]
MSLRLSGLILSLFFLSACSATPPVEQATPSADIQLQTYYDYALYNPNDQQIVENTQALAKQLADSQVILFGEYHSHPAIHLAQLRLLEALYQQQNQISLSMEQFNRSQQALLDSYLANEIGEEWLIKQTKAWDNYRSDYRPLVEFAKDKQLTVVAANAPREHVRCIGQQGLGYLEGLEESERSKLAQDFSTNDPAYQQRLFGNAHHGDSEQSKNHFFAMLAWDETMAESIALQLQSQTTQQVMHTVGNFHIEQRQGTYSRVEQRLEGKKVSSLVTINHSEFVELSEQQKQALGDYLIVVKSLPVRYQNKANQQAEFKHIKKQSSKQCKSAN